MRLRWKALAVGAAIVVVIALAGTLAVDAQVDGFVSERLFKPVDAPVREVAVVLGAKPGPLLTQRMDAACALVVHEKVTKLLLTGLAEEMPYMRGRAQECGAEVLVDDGATRTLENLRRARDLFALKQVLVVTQRFHMGRALYLADALGLDAVGVLAEGEPRALSGRLRERFARVKAFVDVALLD